MLAEVAGCSTLCLWLVLVGSLPVNGPIRTQRSVVSAKACKECMHTLPPMCARVVLAVGSEDFTVSHALPSQCSVCTCAWLSCPVTVAPSQNRTPANCWLITRCGLPVTWD